MLHMVRYIKVSENITSTSNEKMYEIASDPLAVIYRHTVNGHVNGHMNSNGLPLNVDSSSMLHNNHNGELRYQMVTHYPVDELDQASWRQSDKNVIKCDFYGGNNNTKQFNDNLNSENTQATTILNQQPQQYQIQEFKKSSSRNSSHSSSSSTSSSTMTPNASSIHAPQSHHIVDCDRPLPTYSPSIDRVSFGDHLSIASGPVLNGYCSDYQSTSSTLERRSTTASTYGTANYQVNDNNCHSLPVNANNNNSDACSARLCITDLNGSLDNISSVFDQMSIQSDFATASYRCYDPPSIQPILVSNSNCNSLKSQRINLQSNGQTNSLNLNSNLNIKQNGLPAPPPYNGNCNVYSDKHETKNLCQNLPPQSSRLTNTLNSKQQQMQQDHSQSTISSQAPPDHQKFLINRANLEQSLNLVNKSQFESQSRCYQNNGSALISTNKTINQTISKISSENQMNQASETNGIHYPNQIDKVNLPIPINQSEQNNSNQNDSNSADRSNHRWPPHRRYDTQIIQSQHIAAAMRQHHERQQNATNHSVNKSQDQQGQLEPLEKPVIQFDYPTTSLARINRYRRSTRLTRTSSMIASPKSSGVSGQIDSLMLVPTQDSMTLTCQSVASKKPVASVLSKPRAPSILLPSENDFTYYTNSGMKKANTLDSQSVSIPPPTPYRSHTSNTMMSLQLPNQYDDTCYNYNDDGNLYNIGTTNNQHHIGSHATGKSQSPSEFDTSGTIPGLSRVTSTSKLKNTAQKLANFKKLFTLPNKKPLSSKKSLFDSTNDIRHSRSNTSKLSRQSSESPPNQGSRASIGSVDPNNDSDTTLVSASGLSMPDLKSIARIEELEAQLRAKEKDLTNLRLESMSNAYSIDNLRTEVNKLVRENFQLRLENEKLTEMLKQFTDTNASCKNSDHFSSSGSRTTPPTGVSAKSDQQQQQSSTVTNSSTISSFTEAQNEVTNNGIKKISDNYSRMFNFSSIQ